MELEVSVEKKAEEAAKDPCPTVGSVGDGPRFRDLGGMAEVLAEMEMEVIAPMCHPQVPRRLGIRPVSGILLHGPPGCGKTTLAWAIANEAGVPLHEISGPQIVSSRNGASEESIREIFVNAQRTAPSIIFIDEIDAIASKRENSDRNTESRIVTQLMTCMEKPPKCNDDQGMVGHVVVIGATNRPDSLDAALRRPGRFDWEILLKAPDESARLQILLAVTKDIELEDSCDMAKIARSTPGFVGADLKAVADTAGRLAMRRIYTEKRRDVMKSREPCESQEHGKPWWTDPWSSEPENSNVTMADFEEAVKKVQPAAKREGFSEIPTEKWEDVGGLDNLRREFEEEIIKPIKCPEDYEGSGVESDMCFMLYGPPGCGKTLIAKAVAHEAGAHFIHIKGPELVSKYVGESELSIRKIFSRARTVSPCIIFFDEIDALTPQRGTGDTWAVDRIVNQLLVELDGGEQRRGVYVIGATNRLEKIDQALLRPGRFGKTLYVPLPNADQRALILQAVGRKKPIHPSVDLNAIAHMEACENFSGADLAFLAKQAARAALEERRASRKSGTPHAIKTTHFELALKQISPSVNVQTNVHYKKIARSFKSL